MVPLVVKGGLKVSSDTVSLSLKNDFKVSGKRFFWFRKGVSNISVIRFLWV